MIDHAASITEKRDLISPLKKTASVLFQPERTGSPFVFGSENYKGFFHELKSFMKELWIDKRTKNLLIFVILQLLWIVFEIFYGFHINLFTLVANGTHTAFDFLSLCIALFARRHIHPRKPTFEYSYGFSRLEILAGFANAIFMIFLTLFLFVHGIIELYSPYQDTGSIGTLTFVGVVSLVFSLMGSFVFHNHNYALIRAETGQMMPDERDSKIGHGTMMMVSSLLVIATAWFMSLGMVHADGIGALCICAMLHKTCVPIAFKTGRVLLVASPASLLPALDKCLRECSTYPGVLEITQAHFWVESPGAHVGSLHVRVRREADEGRVLAQIRHCFNGMLAHFTVQIVKDSWDDL
eukprot:GCRY01004088.1.p1 GENE.GCRY01004088.1~~GCRY01004088.1.p1  ORF type:complete len:353 (-),score=54.26 GCRY01004088.1:205-1263(-)